MTGPVEVYADKSVANIVKTYAAKARLKVDDSVEAPSTACRVKKDSSDML
jgi:hypothetical protein